LGAQVLDIINAVGIISLNKIEQVNKLVTINYIEHRSLPTWPSTI